tara:strand:- start:515 stop:790 length:276 start_codon:yes stop_codon:yes gene_type:complete
MNYQLAPNVLFQKVGDETVILDPESGEYYTLNAIGTFIVEQFQQGSTKAEVINLVFEAYQAPEDEIIQDIEELLAQMLKQGLFTTATNKTC